LEKIYSNCNNVDKQALNYDLVVDSALNLFDNHNIQNQSIKEFHDRSNTLLSMGIVWGGNIPSQSIQERDKGVYIKLHGSINWVYCPSPDCPNNRSFWTADFLGKPCFLCGTSLESAIVPPTMKKSFEKFPKLGFLWHVAFNKLKEADRIIVIGMSFPDSDYYLKWLVRQAMIERQKSGKGLSELLVVNTDKSIFERTKYIFGVTKVSTYNGLDDWLRSLPSGERK
jgi:hypothetical protein